MDITALKVISTASIFVIAVLGIFASYKLKKFTKWFDILSAFSGGVLIATAYTHMLPEAIEQYDEYLMGGHDHSHEAVTTIAPTVQGVNVLGATTSDLTTTPQPLPPKKKCNHAHHHHRRLQQVTDADEEEHDHAHNHYYPLIPFLAALAFICLFLVERGAILYMQNKKNHSADVEDKLAAEVESIPHSHCHGESGLTCSSDAGKAHEEHEAPNCCKDIKSMEKMSELTAFALIIAVSLHAVVEGMGLGASSNNETLLSTFIGIAVHKGLEGFAVGANLIESAVTTRRFLMYASVVCLASPLGALIGYLMTLGNAKTGVVAPILGALAVGTFIQVATMEFLPRTFAKQENFCWKAAGLLLGFGIMSTMPVWFGEHEHV